MIKNVLRRVGENVFIIRLWDILFPRRCPICDEILEPEAIERKIHEGCEAKLHPVREPVCMRCGRPLEDNAKEYCYDCNRKQRYTNMAVIEQGKSLFLYQGTIKQTMYRFKYSNRREYAQFFAEHAMERYCDWMREKRIEVIVPVPMYDKKRRVRGYNQAEVFARALSKASGISVDVGLVKRVIDTIPQKGLGDLERKNNLKNAFQKCENIVQYSQILVVDDIYTTGSTAEAVVEVIKTDVNKIYFLSICIGKGM